RQKRVGDIERAAGKALAQLWRQYLHVARKHHQVGLMLVDHFEHARCLRRLPLRRGRYQREVVKRNVVARGELIELLVVRDDRRNLDAKLTSAVAEQQVVQAMTDLR